MKGTQHVFSLRNKLVMYLVLVSLLPACIISLYYYDSSSGMLEERMGESSAIMAAHVMENIEGKIMQANTFLEWVYINSDVVELLKRKPLGPMIYDSLKEQAVKRIDEQISTLPVTNYMTALFITSFNNTLLRNGPDAYTIEVKDFSGEEWYVEGLKGDGSIHWNKPVRNYSIVSEEPYVIPVAKVLKDLDNGSDLGYMVTMFSQGLLKSCYESMLTGKDTEVYVIDREGNVISSNEPLMMDVNISKISFYPSLGNENKPYFRWNDGKLEKLVVFKKSSNQQYCLIVIHPLDNVRQQVERILKTVLLLLGATLVLAYAFSVFLSWNFTRPIKMLVERVNKISCGDFSRPVGLRVKNELGVLGRDIDKMALDIQELLDSSIQKEEEKRKLEIRVLQSQINPHFLYNTLNSIKWMAVMQGSEGIAKMVTCLGKILKSAFGNLYEKISIEEELCILKDYIHIQRVRYKGKVEFIDEISDEQILKCAIVKLTLQPLVENAIFHGIEPKEGLGLIKISALRAGGDIQISVTDNGVGINPDRIRTLLDGGRQPGSKGLMGIGVFNVDKRIKLVYGNAYGLSLESEQGQYTRVTIHIPAEACEGGAAG